MRIVIQRVLSASITIENKIHSLIHHGLLILLGVEHEDTVEDVEWLVSKITALRIFNDSDGKMNVSNEDVGGAYLVVSQFTLHASTKKGNRPSFIKAATPLKAQDLYELFVRQLRAKTTQDVQTGVFGADMKINLINDGPVTIIIDSKNRE
jgi:D-tyrosyl-tRNA(Tyr) deacylase